MHDIKVIYEDNHLIAVNKPNGVLVQPDETGDHTLMDQVKLYIKWKYDKPGDVFLGSFHRLDRPVSGVVLFARTSKALTRMNDLIRERKVGKEYLAITEERPQDISGQLTHYLIKDTFKNRTHVHNSKRGSAKKAVLRYELTGYLKNHSLIKIDLETGRSHQIRAQLAKIGAPVCGDLKYGGAQKLKGGSIALHHQTMSFVHPVKKEPVTISCDPPEFHPWSIFF